MKKLTRFFFIRMFYATIMFIFGVSLNLAGQTEPVMMSPVYSVPGAIITNNDDTIYGKIRISKYVERNFISRIVFTDMDGNKIKYDAGSIKGFAVGDKYESRISTKKGNNVFLRRLEEGKITVFYNPNSTGLSTGGFYTTETGDVTGISFMISGDRMVIRPTYETRIIEVKKPKVWYSSYFIEKGDESLMKIKREDYENQWQSLFGDCPGIVKEVENNPKLEKYNCFLLMVTLYNETCK